MRTVLVIAIALVLAGCQTMTMQGQLDAMMSVERKLWLEVQAGERSFLGAVQEYNRQRVDRFGRLSGTAENYFSYAETLARNIDSGLLDLPTALNLLDFSRRETVAQLEQERRFQEAKGVQAMMAAAGIFLQIEQQRIDAYNASRPVVCNYRAFAGTVTQVCQ